MILCLNLNAAIDKTIVVSPFELNKIHRPKSVICLAGGKGCNVGRALKTLGEVPVISGWVGGFSGQFIESELRREGIRTDFVYTNFESRTCTTILDSEKQTLTEIYEIGEPVPVEKVDQLREHVQAIIRGYAAVALSGSLPAGVPFDFYADLIKIAREAGVLTFFDSSGNALCKGLEAGPFLLKSNEAEVKSLLGVGANDTLDFVQAAGEVSTRFGTKVLLSLGANGAVAANGHEVLIVKNPSVDAKSAVGSGDCMLAGLVHGFLKGLSFEESIICGVAAGAANTLTIGAGRFKIEDFERLHGQVHISKEVG